MTAITQQYADLAVLKARLDELIEAFTLKRIIAALLVMCMMLFAIGWFSREDPSKKPYLDILGGGFVFNYREGQVYYGFTAIVEKPLAVGSVVKVTFENPDGGKPLVVSRRVDARTNRYAFRSPLVRGVEAHKPYHVVISVYDRLEEKLIWKTERDYTSVISDDVVPTKPLVIGPGYTHNPNADQ